ncbi:MAG: hypothetical protein GF355_08055 [Candidatus Eisenbacteria bacterium]|nr:hypothetical protein [Candidatus Eisenbacteria bacterium]
MPRWRCCDRPTSWHSPGNFTATEASAVVPETAGMRRVDREGRVPVNRSEAGRWGERLAACFLEGLGCRILERNLRAGRCEIDLLVRDRQAMAMVEVRLRSSLARGRPEESVTWRKRRRLERVWRDVARRYPDTGWIRMDIVAVVRRGARCVEIRHFPNAWRPRGVGTF